MTHTIPANLHGPGMWTEISQMQKETQFQEVDICMGNAIAVCDRYADLLLKVLDGEMDKDAVMEAMGM